MIETPRLTLREWRDADRAAYLDVCNTPAVTSHLGGPASVEQVDAAITRVRACQAKNGFCFWAVERKADGDFLGFCGLKIADTESAPIVGEIEIGWRLREDAWGKGYMREAALATLRWAWANRDERRVIAMTVPANRRSWGLMERIGMTRRPELDFGHPEFPENHPLHRHMVYEVERPGG